VRDTAFQNLKAAKAELTSAEPKPDDARAAVRKVRDEVVLLRGAADLPAANVRNLGLVLYSEHLWRSSWPARCCWSRSSARSRSRTASESGVPGEPPAGTPAQREVAK
jgi:hypothetical protein